MSNLNNNVVAGQNNLGDTTLTKVFVGGLAWETPKEAMREHFEKFGEILEAVIISNKLTGRSKGYGFVSHCLFIIILSITLFFFNLFTLCFLICADEYCMWFFLEILSKKR